MKFCTITALILGSALAADLSLFFEARMDVAPAIRRLLPRPFVDPTALIHAAAERYKVPEAFVRSIVAAESNFNPSAISPKGAIGLMQLMPETARELGADAAVPEENVDAGARYLRFLMTRYQKYRNGMTRAIAAYNAGPGVVDRFRGVPPYPETRQYVARVITFLKRYQRG